MISAYQQITDETGKTFVVLPLKEYDQFLENVWHHEVI